MIKKIGLNTKPRKYKMKEWENKAIDVIKEAKATIKKDPESYPLGWEEIAVYNLQAQMKNRGIFVDSHLDSIRIDMAKQFINMVT